VNAVLSGVGSAVRSSASFSDVDGTILLIRLGCAAVLALLVAGGLLSRRSQDVRRRYWPEVLGLVVAERDDGYSVGGDHGTYEKIIRFRTLDGTEVTGPPRNGSNLGLPVIGREVPVWYDPRDAHQFETRVHALDRAGSTCFLLAIFPAVVLVLSLVR
jgi:hypothetical protein